MTNPVLPSQLLHSVMERMNRTELADELEINPKTITRWEDGNSMPRRYELALKGLLAEMGGAAPADVAEGSFRFIDLFAGIGGIRRAFEDIGGACVFTSEWDSYAQKTYRVNYPGGHELNGDITQVDAQNVPDHDVLLAGFPCQPFSIAGVSKKNALGRAHGFDDETQGTLFFDVKRIIDKKRPKAFLLENVKNLVSHDKGRTFQVIMRTLTEELGYHVQYRVIDGAHFVPQHRERILIVGFRDPVDFDFDAIELPPEGRLTIKDILHRTDGTEPELPWDEGKYFDAAIKKVHAKYTLTDKLWAYLQNYAAKHRAAGNGFGFGLVHPGSVARTLSARYYKDGSEILVAQGKKNPRRLTPRECARLMGFPDDYRIPVSDTRAYKQFGNSVIVDVMRHVAKLMQPALVPAVPKASSAQRNRKVHIAR
jgi:DNA (cytosine-5)-methyltransferase 1